MRKVKDVEPKRQSQTDTSLLRCDPLRIIPGLHWHQRQAVGTHDAGNVSYTEEGGGGEERGEERGGEWRGEGKRGWGGSISLRLHKPTDTFTSLWTRMTVKQVSEGSWPLLLLSGGEEGAPLG